MKKLFIPLMLIFCIISMAGCNTLSAPDSYIQLREECVHQYSTATCTSRSKCYYCDKTFGDYGDHTYSNGICSNCGQSDPNYKQDFGVRYIGDLNVQFESDQNKYIVFFSLKDENKLRVSASGMAKITIKDGNSILYSKNINFDNSDFSYWTNAFWDSERYLCGLYISRSDIKKSSKSDANLFVELTLDDGYIFSPPELTITDLVLANADFFSIPSDFRSTITQSVSAAITSLEGAKGMYDSSLTDEWLQEEYLASAKSFAEMAESSFGIARVCVENYKNVVLSDGSNLYTRLENLESICSSLSIYPNASEFDKTIMDANELYNLLN